ncbi:MAG: LicD family protein [Erysipelotrichaceae bacterium]|nr:LicD family protein [Erysipelotrichaceae bacterium]
MIELNIEVPDQFLEPEVICDYEVSKQMKEIWAIELDLFNELDRVCKKHGLSYFAGAGTLLGAIRHKGFIPWDDDMDFYMLRSDYDKLINLANEFAHPYFLQTGYTDQAIMRTHVRIRNSNTTACSSWEKQFDCNKGVFIDIFPLDGITENKFKDKTQKALNMIYRTVMRNKQPINFKQQPLKISLKQAAINTVVTIAHRDKTKAMIRYENNLRKYSDKNAKMWGNRTLVFDCPKSRRPLEDWMDIIHVPFEFMEIPIPRNYDEILRQQYGNYMEFPKDKTQGKLHEVIIVSTDTPYKEYLKNYK